MQVANKTNAVEGPDFSKETPVVLSSPSFHDITEVISRPIESKAGMKWYIALAVAVSLFMLEIFCWGISFYYGTGMWGNNIPVAWAFPIVNFVFWIGIGHAGTLISAILFLFRQKWRNGIARFAEGMTIFAVMTAGLFPLFHTGRPWLPLYLFPYPNKHAVWTNFLSPLLWDVFAVSTYFTVSLCFWYVGLIPDFATLRDRTLGKDFISKVRKTAYSVLSLGWRFSNRHWRHYERVYLILAGVSTPLVLSVHTIVSFDFAVAGLPGWHTTIFPPYFVAGAIFSGFAMVVTVLVFIRYIFDMEHIITIDTLEKMNKIILLTGTLVGYAYGMEFFIAWYSGNIVEQFAFINRAFGPYAWAYWIMISCNVITPQIFWFRNLRRSVPIMFIASIFVNIGMWFERYVITVTTLVRDFLPSSWGWYNPTLVDFGLLIGSFGMFFTLTLLFVKFMPVVAISEVKGVLAQAKPHHHHGGGHE
jgi:molybdopterin-containing oxidoreductase family membrane subunit